MKFTAEELERETFWWCFRRQVRVVGGWRFALFSLPLICQSARELQADVKQWHRQRAARFAEWEGVRRRLALLTERE